MTSYTLAPDGVYFSIQGEGHLRGFHMAFLRLAGCSVGCPGCDTNYTKSSRHETHELIEMLNDVMPEKFRDRWGWITGGEPYDRDLLPLLRAMKAAGMSTAVATSGKHRAIHGVDWLSVSYHGGYPLLQRYGHELKLVEGLNGLDLERFAEEYPDDQIDFFYRYVQPMTVNGVESRESLERCQEFLSSRPNWSLSRQDHLLWEVR